MESDHNTNESSYSWYRIQLRHRSCFGTIKQELSSGGIFTIKQGLLEVCSTKSVWERGAERKDAIYFIARQLDNEDDSYFKLKLYNSQRRSLLSQIENNL